MNLLIATHNVGKLKRYKNLLKGFDVNIKSLNDLQILEKADEPFDNSKDNAIYKAKFYAKISGLPTLAIDEAVVTNFLPEGMQPGVYVRRLKKDKAEANDEEVLEIWKQVFEKYPQEDKRFVWDFSLVYFNPETEYTNFCKIEQRNIVAKEFSKRINPGYPMSSFLIPENFDRPHADLSDEEELESDKNTFKSFVEIFGEWIKK